MSDREDKDEGEVVEKTAEGEKEHRRDREEKGDKEGEGRDPRNAEGVRRERDGDRGRVDRGRDDRRGGNDGPPRERDDRDRGDRGGDRYGGPPRGMGGGGYNRGADDRDRRGPPPGGDRRGFRGDDGERFEGRGPPPGRNDGPRGGPSWGGPRDERGGFQRGRDGRMGGDRMGGGPMLRDEMRTEEVDREKMCPMLLRIFCKMNEHHNDDEFSYQAQPCDSEVRVHTWRDATMSEITELLAQVHRDIRHGATRCSFKVVYPDSSGKYVSSIIGSTSLGRRTQDDVSRRSLESIRFRTGDFLSVAIYPAKSGYNRAKEMQVQQDRQEAAQEAETTDVRKRSREDEADE